MDINIELIEKLYRKYETDLIRVKLSQKKIYDKINDAGPVTIQDDYGKSLIMSANNAQLCDIEAEITYLLIRECEPLLVVEISPYCGWSTTWILQALTDNNRGTLISYDKISESTQIVPINLKPRWQFKQGDVKDNLDDILDYIDFLFMDSDHSREFARWYIQTLFPRVKMNGFICAHDIFKGNLDSEHFKDGEDEILFEFLRSNKIGYFTAATLIPSTWKSMNKKILALKEELGIDNIQESNKNSMLFFRKEEEWRQMKMNEQTEEIAVNSKEYWDTVYNMEISNKIEQRSDPIMYDLIIDKIKDYSKVMDVGCGRGDFLLHLLKKKENINQVYAVDHSTVALEYLRKRSDRINTCTDLDKLAEMVPKPYFDIITILHTLEHFKDPIGFIQKLKMFLKHDGILCIALPIDDKPWAEHYKIWNMDDVLELVNQFDCWYRIRYFDQIIVPKGYRNQEHDSIQAYTDGTFKKEALIFMRFN